MAVHIHTSVALVTIPGIANESKHDKPGIAHRSDDHSGKVWARHACSADDRDLGMT